MRCLCQLCQNQIERSEPTLSSIKIHRYDRMVQQLNALLRQSFNLLIYYILRSDRLIKQATWPNGKALDYDIQGKHCFSKGTNLITRNQEIAGSIPAVVT